MRNWIAIWRRPSGKSKVSLRKNKHSIVTEYNIFSSDEIDDWMFAQSATKEKKIEQKVEIERDLWVNVEW
jgi:hypothetical protein